MSTVQVEAFADNWSYLRTELSWLDQLLMAAVARHRKHQKEVDRIAQTKGDRATSHWWKGIVSLEGNTGYDEHRKAPAPTPAPSVVKLGYQQQLDLRVKVSQQRGTLLALPALRDRLGLSVFEKNVILIGLAPEVNRRYARLYRYLKGDDETLNHDLPTLDLVLRLLCRNDQEWSLARKCLTAEATLIRRGLIEVPMLPTDTRLNAPIRLADSLVDYLLADKPTVASLETLLVEPLPLLSSELSSTSSRYLVATAPTTTWDDWIGSPPLKDALRSLAHQLRVQDQVHKSWGFDHLGSLGRLVAFVGDAGTGKTTAAEAIAHTCHLPLVTLDLAFVDPMDYGLALQDILTQDPKLLWVKSAHHWLGRHVDFAPTEVQKFLQSRRQGGGLTLLGLPRLEPLHRHAQGVPSSGQLDQVLVFARPDVGDRLRLWQRAFPPTVPLSPELDWQRLAAEFPLSGGEIQAIAHVAALQAAAQAAPHLEIHHILTALWQRGYALKLQAVAVEDLGNEGKRDRHTVLEGDRPSPFVVNPSGSQPSA